VEFSQRADSQLALAEAESDATPHLTPTVVA
jgi:hypothetical protein